MSNSLTLKAPAKINLSLRVGEKRADGFHDIVSVMQAVSLYDTITIANSDAGQDSLRITGLESSKLDSEHNDNHSDNLALRALGALRMLKPDLPYCHIELEKVIPIGGGLGGGSSDCASVLKGANQLFDLGLSNDELIQIGAELGSDVPFFFSDGSALVGGRGELFEPIEPPMDYSLVLINPGIHISTAEAFSELDQFRDIKEVQKAENAEITPLTSQSNGFNFLGSGDAASWWRALEEEGSDFESLYLSGRCKAKSINDFAKALLQIQDCLRRLGASLIVVSGSGSTVFGVFSGESKKNIESEQFDFMVKRGWRVFFCQPISLLNNSAIIE